MNEKREKKGVFIRREKGQYCLESVSPLVGIPGDIPLGIKLLAKRVEVSG